VTNWPPHTVASEEHVPKCHGGLTVWAAQIVTVVPLGKPSIFSHVQSLALGVGEEVFVSALQLGL